MIPIPSLLLFPGLVVGFSVLFMSTIYKSESICSDNSEKSEGRLSTNDEDSYLVYKTILHDNTTKRHSLEQQIPTKCRKNKIILINNIQDTETESINQEPEEITKPNMNDNKVVYTPMDFVIEELNQIDQVDELINKTKLLKDEIEGFLSEFQKLGIGLMNLLESSHRIIKEIKALRNRCENIGTIRCLHGVNA
ncbi:82_t:CDS:2 [Gigaspora rosea]|nr:82_t:CDS:2 [Gigaspora rosea]